MRMTDIGEEADRIPYDIATAIMNVDSTVNGYAHSHFNIPHSLCRQSPVNFFMKALSN